MEAFASATMLLLLTAACAGPSTPVAVRSPAAQLASAEVARQVRRCYRSPRVPSAGRRIVTRLLVRYGPDGTLIGLPILIGQQGVTSESRPYAARMTEAAKAAVIRCDPMRLPPPERRRAVYFYLTFSPQMRAGPASTRHGA